MLAMELTFTPPLEKLLPAWQVMEVFEEIVRVDFESKLIIFPICPIIFIKVSGTGFVGLFFGFVRIRFS